MGWLDSAITGLISVSPVGIPGAIVKNNNPFNSYTGGNGVGGPLAAAIAAANNARAASLRNTIITDKQLDQFTQKELLNELNLQGTPNAQSHGILTLDQIESTIAGSKTSQDSVYMNRRAESNKINERQDKPGLAAQTMLTQNLNTGITPTNVANPLGLMKGQTNGQSTNSTGTILT